MPWNGLTFHLNLLQPFQTLYDSLTQDPASNPIEVPSIEGVTHTFENLWAGSIIDFDAYTEGSPACPALCDIPPEFQIPSLVEAISKLDPSNETLANWVTLYNQDPALVNMPTQPQIDASVALLQTGIYNLDADTLADVDKVLADINPELPFLYTNAGYFTDPAYLDYGQPGVPQPDTLDPVYGGYNPMLVWNDLLTLATNNEWNWNAATPEALWFLAAPLTSPDPLSAASAAAETPNLLTSFDPSTMSADLSTILAGLGTTVGSDAISAALADLSAQFTAELANIVPQSVLGLF
jgi:hypothetical protein